MTNQGILSQYSTAQKLRAHHRRIQLHGLPLSIMIGGSFGILIAVTVGFILFVTISTNLDTTFKLLNDKTILVMNSLEDQLTSYLDAAAETTEGVANLIDRLNIDFRDENRERLRDVLAGAFMGQRRIDALVYTNLDGKEFGVYENASGVLEYIDRNIPSESGIELLREIGAESPPVWGPLIEEQGYKLVNVSAPLVLDGQLEGYITAAISFIHLEHVVMTLDQNENQTNFVLTDSRKMIAHSESMVMDSDVDSTNSEGSNIDPIIDQMSEVDALPVSDEAKELGINVHSIDHDTGDYLVLTKIISGYSNEPWLIGSYFRRNTILTEFLRATLSAVAGVIALIFALVIAYYIAKRTTRPLLHVANQSEKVAGLQFNDVSTLPRGSVRELNQLASAFNSMVAGLKALNTYVPRSLFRKLMKIGFDDATRSRKQELTIMFTDIAGFTTMSEKMDAEETAHFLNDHFAILVQAVEAEGGTVDKFMGDGMLAFWGAPDEREDHAEAAIRAVKSIIQGFKDLNKKASKEGTPLTRVRVGLHTGYAIVGNIGAHDRVNYTIVGDAVNVCERLQSLGKEIAKACEVTVLASNDTMNKLPGEIPKSDVGTHKIRGRSTPIAIWQLFGSSSKEDNND